MSMTTELIDRLNEHADLLKEMGFDPDGMVMSDYKESTYTIQLLSEKLHASQMEKSNQYYNGGWIPCEERLPDDDHIVMISIHEDRIDYVSTGFYDNGWEMWLDHYEEMVNVVAWMPLPEPYKKEGE